MQSTESEVKLKVDDLAVITRRLEALGAKLSAPRVYEKNVRYENAAETLTASRQTVRLRQDTRVRLTYKDGGTTTDGIVTRTELEITVSDFETADLILQKLGYHAAWIYEKYRTTYELGGCEVVLDEMPYGSMIEIEGEIAPIENVLKLLDLAAMPRVNGSYSDVFFRIKDRLNLTFRDLTFENFQGINIPGDIFYIDVRE